MIPGLYQRSHLREGRLETYWLLCLTWLGHHTPLWSRGGSLGVALLLIHLQSKQY